MTLEELALKAQKVIDLIKKMDETFPENHEEHLRLCIMATIKDLSRTELPKFVTFNLNNAVKFKMTEKGRVVYREYFAALNMKPVYPKIDENGYYHMDNAWEFFHIFGHTFQMGFDQAVELDILLEID